MPDALTHRKYSQQEVIYLAKAIGTSFVEEPSQSIVNFIWMKLTMHTSDQFF